MSTSNHRKGAGWTIATKTKLPYFKGSEIEFKGSDSPSLSKYAPNHKWAKESSSNWTQSKQERFQKGTESELDIVRNRTHQYGGLKNAYKGRGCTLQTGLKYTYKVDKSEERYPGPKYSTDYYNSLSKQAD